MIENVFDNVKKHIVYYHHLQEINRNRTITSRPDSYSLLPMMTRIEECFDNHVNRFANILKSHRQSTEHSALSDHNYV